MKKSMFFSFYVFSFQFDNLKSLDSIASLLFLPDFVGTFPQRKNKWSRALTDFDRQLANEYYV